MAGYPPAGPGTGSSWSAGHWMKVCLDRDWSENSLWSVAGRTCSCGKCLELMMFPAVQEGKNVARRPGSGCDGRLGYASSESKPGMGDKTNWSHDGLKGKTGKRHRCHQTCWLPSITHTSIWLLPVLIILICGPVNRRTFFIKLCMHIQN